jgi:hypothetical protein
MPNPSTQEAEAGRPEIEAQPGLYSLSQKTNEKKKEEEKRKD